MTALPLLGVDTPAGFFIAHENYQNRHGQADDRADRLDAVRLSRWGKCADPLENGTGDVWDAEVGAAAANRQAAQPLRGARPAGDFGGDLAQAGLLPASF